MALNSSNSTNLEQLALKGLIHLVDMMYITLTSMKGLQQACFRNLLHGVT